MCGMPTFPFTVDQHTLQCNLGPPLTRSDRFAQVVAESSTRRRQKSARTGMTNLSAARNGAPKVGTKRLHLKKVLGERTDRGQAFPGPNATANPRLAFRFDG